MNGVLALFSPILFFLFLHFEEKTRGLLPYFDSLIENSGYNEIEANESIQFFCF
jgi:hypothetical protein